MLERSSDAHAGVSVGYLPQDPPLPENATVLEAVLAAESAVGRAVRGYAEALRESEAKGGVITKVRAEVGRTCTRRQGKGARGEGAGQLARARQPGDDLPAAGAV